MTDTSAGSDVAFVPSGRPVARFVTALVAIALVLVAVAWSGLFAPRVRVSVDQGTFDQVTKHGTAVVMIHNLGPASARIDKVRLAGRYVRSTPPRYDRSMKRDARARVAATYSIDCDAYRADLPKGATDPALQVRVHVVGAGASGRWVRAESTGSSNFCGFAGRPSPPLP